MNVTLLQFQYNEALPAGAVYLATSLERAKIKYDLKLFSVIDFYKAGRSVDLLIAALEDPSHDIIAVGCYSDMLPHVLIALRKIKQRGPHKKIILGGIGPSLVAREILDEFSFVDFLVKGPGAKVLPLLIKKIIRGEKYFGDLPTVCTRNQKTDAAAGMQDPIWDIPEPVSYGFIKNLERFSGFSIKTSSGCPYQCTFCYARPAVNGNITYRDMKNVLYEIEALRARKKKPFLMNIIDEGFILNRKRVIDFCHLLKENRLNVTWTCYGRVNCVDEELLRVMFDAECKRIYFGIESGSDRILKKIKKGFSSDEAMTAVLLAKKIFPLVVASFIYRYPFETLNDFRATFSMLRYFRFSGISTQLHPFVPVKDSEIYARYRSRLRFSLSEPSDYLGSSGGIGRMPSEARELVLKYPEVFYDYGYYKGRDLATINAMIKNNAKTLYS